MPSQGCSERAPDWSTFYHAGVHLRKVEARFLMQITGGSSVLGCRTLRYHDNTLFSIFGYSFQHPRASANTDYRLRTQHSWTGNDRITTFVFLFLLLAIPLAQAVCFLLLWPYTIGKQENSRYRGVRYGKKAQMRKRCLPLLEMEYIGIVAWNRPSRGWWERKGAKKNKNWSEK